MEKTKVYTPDEIKDLYEQEKPKHIALKSPGGQFEVPFNNSKLPSAEKIKEIYRTLKKKSLPHGIYLFVVKNNFAKTSTEYSYPVGVGEWRLSDNNIPAPSPAKDQKSVWGVDEAVKHLADNKKLELELENANNKIESLEEEIEDLEEELNKYKTLSETKTEGSDSWINKLIEIGSPLLQKYFDQRDQEIKLLSQKINSGRNNNRVTPDDPSYQQYLQNIIDSKDEENISSEMLYLKNNHNDFYLRLCKTYGIDPEQ